MSDLDPPRSLRLAPLLVAALLHAAAFLVLLPPWMGEDEPWQVEYASHVAAGHAPWGGIAMSGASADKPHDDRELMSLSQLQVRRRLGGVEEDEIRDKQGHLLDSMREHAFWRRIDFMEWGPGAENFDQVQPDFTATNQPPAYYLVTGLLLGALGVEEVEAQMWALRGFSLLCYLAVVVCAWIVGRHLSVDSTIAAACALFVAWLPMHARQAAVVNNDVLAKVFSGAAIAVAAGLVAGHGGRRRAAGLVVLLALGLVTKTTAAGALAVGVPALALAAREHLGRARRLALGGLITLAVAAAGFATWWFAHNPAMPRNPDALLMRVLRSQHGFREDLWRTFVGAFNWYSRDLPQAAYAASGVVLALATLGALVASVRRLDARRGLLLLCWAAVTAQLGLIALRGVAVGRYFFPVLPALAGLVAVGLLTCLPRRARRKALALLCVLMILLDGLFLWSGLAWNQYAVWGV
jgi:hypothetical protein